MLTYKFTTKISDDGKIFIPKHLKDYYSNSAEIIMLVPEKKDSTNLNIFYNLIKEYNKIDEPELEINELYKNRKNNDERKLDFN